MHVLGSSRIAKEDHMLVVHVSTCEHHEILLVLSERFDVLGNHRLMATLIKPPTDQLPSMVGSISIATTEDQTLLTHPLALSCELAFYGQILTTPWERLKQQARDPAKVIL